PRRHADRAMLCTLRELRELERLELELRDRAQRERYGDLERSRRREPGPEGQRRGQVTVEPDRRAAERGELGCDGGDIASPAGAFLEAGPVGSETGETGSLGRAQLDRFGRRRFEPHAEVERSR